MTLARRSLLLSALALPLLPMLARAATAAVDPSARHIAMLVYPGFTALDFVGPHHFLANLPGTQLHVVTTEADLSPVTSDLGLTVMPTLTMAECPLDLEILFVPGGTSGTIAAASNPDVLRFIAERMGRSRYVTSVCTGSLILGAAGALVGKRATSHWVAVDVLEQFGAIPVRERVVRDGHVITGAGVSAGIDFGIVIAEEIGGRMLAEAGVLISEYAPEPPINGGTLETARPEIAQLLQRNLDPFVEQARNLEMLR